MKSTFRVLFFLKRDKVKKNGNMPIMARITIDGKLAQFNTKLEVNPKNWQAKTGKVSGRGAEFTRMNEMLDGIKATLYKHYQTILERDGYVTAEKVRNTFLGKEEKAKTLLQVFAQHGDIRIIIITQINVEYETKVFHKFLYFYVAVIYITGRNKCIAQFIQSILLSGKTHRVEFRTSYSFVFSIV